MSGGFDENKTIGINSRVKPAISINGLFSGFSIANVTFHHR